jgi:rfaE bifunctional protein kinase chain/domain
MTDTATLSEHVRRFAECQVLVVGDVMLDHYTIGSVSRISPEAPVPVVHAQRTDLRPGGASNVALNVARLGGRAAILGIVGDDEDGARVRDLLETRHVDTAGLLAHPDCRTTKKMRIVGNRQQIVRVDFEDPAGARAAGHEELVRRLAERAPHADAVIFSDYNKGVAEPLLVGAVREFCRARGVPLLVDAKPTNMHLFAGASVIVPNVEELCRFARIEAAKDDYPALADAAATLSEALEGASVLVTLSEHGMLLHVPGAAHRYEHLACHAVEVFDVSGAGDTVASALGLALATGLSLREGAEIANAAAAVVVSKFGTASVTPEELLARLGSA